MDLRAGAAVSDNPVSMVAAYPFLLASRLSCSSAAVCTSSAEARTGGGAFSTGGSGADLGLRNDMIFSGAMLLVGRLIVNVKVICRPLQDTAWQHHSHSRKVVVIVWMHNDIGPGTDVVGLAGTELDQPILRSLTDHGDCVSYMA